MFSLEFLGQVRTKNVIQASLINFPSMPVEAKARHICSLFTLLKRLRHVLFPIWRRDILSRLTSFQRAKGNRRLEGGWGVCVSLHTCPCVPVCVCGCPYVRACERACVLRIIKQEQHTKSSAPLWA